MDIIASLNTAFTHVQRSESMNFSTGDNRGTQVGYRERESTSGASGNGGMNRMQNFLSDSSGSPMQTAMQNLVGYDRAEGGGMQLRTQEGDVVKLKFLNSESMNAQNQQFENGGSILSDFSVSGSSSSQFKVVVEGDLNAEELSAVRDVLVQAHQMANSFFNGGVEKAFSLASQFDVDSEQLANVNMQLNVTENFTYSSAVLESQNASNPATQPSDPTMPIAPAITSVPTVDPASTNTQSNPAAIAVPVTQPDLTATAPANQPNVSELTQEAPFTPDPVETLVHTEPDPVDDLAGALSTITNFLNQLATSMNSINQQFQGQNSSSAFSFSGGFQLQVVSSLVGQMESQLEQPSPSGKELAAATIDIFAMRMDAHVDAMI